jgi:HrpA-like RNA helicase
VINIIVTEPRRVSATSVSARVGLELGDSDPTSSLVGYTVRLDSKVGPACVIEFVTIGVLLKRVQLSKGECLTGYSHIIVDEVHERSVDSDFLLLLLREYREKFGKLKELNKHYFKQDDAKQEQQQQLDLSCSITCNRSEFPKIVFMSATVDEEFICNYWKGFVDSIAVCHIPGMYTHIYYVCSMRAYVCT